jgi:hypothetical protein
MEDRRDGEIQRDGHEPERKPLREGESEIRLRRHYSSTYLPQSREQVYGGEKRECEPVLGCERSNWRAPLLVVPWKLRGARISVFHRLSMSHTVAPFAGRACASTLFISLPPRGTRAAAPWGSPWPQPECAPRGHSGADGGPASTRPTPRRADSRRSRFSGRQVAARTAPRARRCIDPISEDEMDAALF